MKKVFLFFAALFMAIVASAQVNEVTLTVLGTGVNEEQATLQALRSAIEQSFGTFVSANTTILNDKLVQDEIVSVSNGNVKDYKKLAVSSLQNGQVAVSVRATVSINKLISYAKSKGSRAEFAGQTFSANLKLMQLKVSSTKKAYQLMIEQMKQISKNMFDYEISVGSPVLSYDKLNYRIPYTIEAYANMGSSNFSTLYQSTCKSLEISEEEVRKYDNELGMQIYCSRSHPLKDIYMPLNCNEKIKLEEQVVAIYRDALTHYSIKEVNRVETKDWIQEIDAFGIHYIKNRKNELVHNDIEVIDKRGQSRDFHYVIIDWEALKVAQIKEPVKLTKAEQKEVKKGTYKGATYTIKYGPQNLVHTIKGYLEIPKNQIDKVSGFELIGVAAPTNKAPQQQNLSGSQQITNSRGAGILGY